MDTRVETLADALTRLRCLGMERYDRLADIWIPPNIDEIIAALTELLQLPRGCTRAEWYGTHFVVTKPLLLQLATAMIAGNLNSEIGNIDDLQDRLVQRIDHLIINAFANKHAFEYE